jgi:hypothetical protein
LASDPNLSPLRKTELSSGRLIQEEFTVQQTGTVLRQASRPKVCNQEAAAAITTTRRVKFGMLKSQV